MGGTLILKPPLPFYTNFCDIAHIPPNLINITKNTAWNKCKFLQIYIFGGVIQKLVYILSLLAFSFGIELSIVNLNQIDRTFDIIYTSSNEFYGFQFDVIGVEVNGVSGAAIEDGFTVSTDNNTVLGFLFSGDVSFPAATDAELVTI